MHADPASEQPASVSAHLDALLHGALARQGGWLPFDQFMALVLYSPGLGYYSRHSRQFGEMPASGSDFVTAPELSPLFGQTLARAVAPALQACGSRALWEFGAGSGALAEQLLGALDEQVDSYTIVDLSGALRERQRERLAPWAHKLRWLDSLPEQISGVVVGNELLDAMPVQLLHFDGQQWQEQGVVADGQGAWAWALRPTTLRPPLAEGFPPGTVTEVHPQAGAFVATLAERLQRGAVFLIDYGFPEAEYYHPQRHGGTLMCHRAHLADPDPLQDLGLKDITAHVNFTGIALAAQDNGLEVLGYTSQARFLLNCGVLDALAATGPALRQVAAVQKLVNEHEMGELFKVMLLAKGCDAGFCQSPPGFEAGDRSHTL